MQKQDNIAYWSIPAGEAVRHYGSAPSGLTPAEAAERLKLYGENSVKGQKKTSAARLLLSQFKNPIVLILILATVISAVMGELIDASIIFLIILASAVLSFLQEYSAGNAIEELRAKVQAKSAVLRGGVELVIPSREVVPGDIVRLSAGSLVPADGLVLESLDFYVNQSILTGEAFPAEKTPAPVPVEASLENRTNCVFMGTSASRGTATVLIVKTGEDTEFGDIAKKLKLRPPETEFERGVRRFGYLLTKIMLILTLAVFAINVLYSRPAIDSLLFSVALAVGITPQLLPAIISIALSKGSRVMAKEGVIVRRLNAIENFGSMDVLCTDKTGTLTEGVIRLDGAVGIDGARSETVLRAAYLNASLQTGMANSLDDTISSIKYIDTGHIEKIGEVPFDFTRERLSVVVREDGGEPVMIVKGALSSVLGVCSRLQEADTESVLDTAYLEQLGKLYEQWSGQGVRVLGVAQKTVPVQAEYEVEDEKDMVFLGFLLLYDHPKEGVGQTISELARKGVSLRIITGDNKLIARHTAESVGLTVSGVLTGADLMTLSDEALWNRVETTTLFAEVDPNQKERIILALKKKYHVVGYMGDGINDVPALHAADISISVDNAVDVAKASADFVLLKKSLAVLNRGIELGRTTFGNTIKYIQVTTSANFGNMFSMAGASLLIPFLPLLPKQILLINFLSDFPAVTIAGDTVDSDILEKPRRWDIKFIRDFMIVFGLISSVFDFVTFAVLLLLFKTSQEMFQSSWFTISVLTELLVLLIMRTHRPFFKSRPAPLLLLSSILVGIVTLLVPYLPFHQYLNLEPMNPLLLLSLFVIAGLYVVVTEVTKHFFYKRRLKQTH